MLPDEQLLLGLVFAAAMLVWLMMICALTLSAVSAVMRLSAWVVCLKKSVC